MAELVAAIQADTIAELERLHRDHCRARAEGGWWALSGFSFQAAVYILRFFEGLCLNKAEPADLARTERLSDIFQPTNSKSLSLIQVKRTLDASRLRSSLEEAYQITRLCSPALLNQIRFQIVCRKNVGNITREHLEAEKRNPKQHDPQLWAEMIDRFDAHEPIVLDHDPVDRLHYLLWQHGVRSSQQLVDTCHGKFLEAFADPSPENIDKLARDISTLFQTSREVWTEVDRPSGRLLWPDDLAADPSASEDRRILIERRPRLRDIQLGRFRDRPITDEASERLGAWCADTASRENLEKVPVFWLGGRSGDGKSVLLLQLLSRLVVSAGAPPVVLLNKAADLPRWIEREDRRQRGLSSPPTELVVVVVDDLHDVIDLNTWAQSLKDVCRWSVPRIAVLAAGPSVERERLSDKLDEVFEFNEFQVPHLGDTESKAFLDWASDRTGKAIHIPVEPHANKLLVQWHVCRWSVPRIAVLAAGPSVERERLSDKLDEVFEFNEFQVPHLGDTESKAFLDWASDRTGKAIHIPVEPHANKLLVQWLFELSKNQTLGAFVDGFERRLEALGLANSVRVILATNALDLPAPANLTRTDDERDALEALCRKDQLHFQLFQGKTTGEVSGYQLAHPGLVWPLYREFSRPIGTTLAYQWARDLSVSLEFMLTAGGNSTSHQILYRLGETELLPLKETRQVKAESGADALEALCRKDQLHFQLFQGKTTGEVSGYQLAHPGLVWPLYREFSRPIGTTLAYQWARDLSVSLEFMLTAGGNSTSHQILYRLGETELLPLKETRQVKAEVYRKHVEGRAGKEPPLRLSIVIRFLEWLCDDLDLELTPDPSQVLVDEILGEKLPAEFPAYAAAWLWRLSSHPRGMTSAVMLRKASRRLILSDPQRFGAGHAVQHLVAMDWDLDASVALALAWVKNNPQDPQAYMPLEVLVARQPQNEDIRDAAVNWLLENPNHLNADRLHGTLVANWPKDTNVRDAAVEWLKANPDHLNAYNPHGALVANWPENTNVRDAAVKWLKANPSHLNAYTLHETLVANWPDDTNVRDAAVNWLKANPNHLNAHSLHATLVANWPEDTNVRDAAVNCLKANPNYLNVYGLHGTLVANWPEDTNARDAAVDWLIANPNHLNAYNLHATLVANWPEDTNVRDAAVDWLIANPNHLNAYNLHATVVANWPEDTNVRDAAVNWLIANPNHLNAHSLHATLVANWPGDAKVVAAAGDWLSQNKNNPKAIHLLSTLIVRSDGAPNWVQFGDEYIETATHRGRAVTILTAVLSSSKGAAPRIDQVIDRLNDSSWEQTHKTLKFQLSKTLANNIDNAFAYLQCHRSDALGEFCANSLGHGLRRYDNRAEEFLEGIDRCPGEFWGKLIAYCLGSNLQSPLLDRTVADFLRDNFHKRGYGLLLRSLRDHLADKPGSINLELLDDSVRKDFEELR